MKYYTETRTKEYLLPETIVLKTQTVTDEALLLSAYSRQNFLGRENTCIVKGKGVIIFDFGQEYYGGLRIVLGGCEMRPNVPNISIRFGESLSECCTPMGEKNASNDHSTRDMTVYMSSNSDMEWGNTGYRYVRIEFIEDGIYRINNVFGTFIHGAYPDAVYETDDETVNKILKMVTRTVFLNAQNYIWDGIKRDQHVWVGDLFPEVLGYLYLYKDRKVVRDTLDFVLDTAGFPCWMNGIPSYNVWFLLVVDAYCRLTGEKNERYAEAVYQILQQLDGCIQGGELHPERAGLSYWCAAFFDWPTFEHEDGRRGVHYLLRYALKAVQRQPLCGAKARELARKISEKLGPLAGEATFKSVAALKLLCGEADEGRVAFLKADGAAGYSSFLSYLISRALVEHGEMQAAFDNLKEYYGGMVAMGATTCWESFDVAWMKNACKITELPREGKEDVHGDRGADCYLGFRHSLCHGWSCGFLPFFVENVVGFHYMDEQCTKVAFTPSLCGLKYVRASIPTPKGMVEVEHKLVNGRVETSCRMPEGLTYDGENAENACVQLCADHCGALRTSCKAHVANLN